MEVKLRTKSGNGGPEYELLKGRNNEHIHLLDKQLIVELFEGQRFNTYNQFIEQRDRNKTKIRLRRIKNTNERVSPQPFYKWIAAALLLPNLNHPNLNITDNYKIECIHFEVVTETGEGIVIRLVSIKIATLTNSIMLTVKERLEYIRSYVDKLKNDAASPPFADFSAYFDALITYNDSYDTIINVAKSIREKYTDMHPNLLSLNGILNNSLEGEFQNADEIPEDFGSNLTEGAKKVVTVNRYERHRQFRDVCINHYEAICIVCKLNFEEIYGEIGKGYIHVHHLTPLSSIGEGYKPDPIKDLVPVCPNCHAMLHKKNPPYTVEDLKQKIKNAK